MMKKYILLFITISFAITYLPAYTGQIRQLSWVDLVPKHLLSDDPLADLPQDKQNLVYWVINTLESLPERGKDTEEFYKEVDETIPMLKKWGIDITQLMAKIKEIQTSMVKELNGQRVRIPGYLLPLESSGSKVTEFLLVPYIGACIHVPPPPPNQIIHVNVPYKEGYRSKELYEPVWVTGVIAVKSMVKDLYLVDGSAGIDIGYTMQAKNIKPYKK
jgi:hypothetical protein